MSDSAAPPEQPADRPAGHHPQSSLAKLAVGAIGIVFACALFYGDSMITPAISVLSAVEGLTTVEADFAPFVTPVAVGILVFLFAIQAYGTARVGALFGPIMVVYFLVISVLGIIHIAADP